MIWSETPDVPDALLVMSALNGDKSAFAVLVGRHVKMAKSVVLRLLQDPHFGRRRPSRGNRRRVDRIAPAEVSRTIWLLVRGDRPQYRPPFDTRGGCESTL